MKQIHARLPLLLLASFLLIFIWSGIAPKDRFTWYLEVAPAVIGGLILVRTYHTFRLTPLLYGLIWVHALILVIGGHYTYAEVPLFNWLRDAYDLDRNYYDRLGHLAQGFVPAILAREILIRKQVVRGYGWLFFLVVSICLAFSAFYELLEFGMALATGTAADAFLGTQGDVWDSQWDMLFALMGAIISQLLLARIHDRQLRFFR
ncbi:DUF2238 domain-containing protein [Aneurinibacillus uraniidurans]|uniref:DUF2238 domain-containing protein n=1 Tax=Aneurinibacillus uraniidurans TaxID=2966586 RepID=UPI00234A0945|nr:DUF2238 domain-containing protein [Aneurinibacillus sp. B1]WCN39000.1 DUF2238 domain-containing protein [Aneurinibacillus sp. B1]